MSDTYAKGHVHEIAKKALAASLALTNEKEVNIWTFGNDAKFEGRYGINQISQIQAISCRNEGTYLQKLRCLLEAIVRNIRFFHLQLMGLLFAT